MSSEHELTSLSAPHILATLRNACATLYPEESRARVVVADAGLDERQVAFSSRAETNWHNILAVAITANRLAVLLDILHTAYPTHQPLLAAIGNYQQFLKAGGQLDAPNQLIAGATIYGDQIQGDKVIGDKTSVGNISHSTAVAIGPGATAFVTITEEAAYKVDGSKNPYLGLSAFSYDDRAIYAGREQLAHETVQHLTSPGSQQTLLFITGASGSGKSSFAQAGLIPLLESHYAAYQTSVRHAIFRPSSQPMVMLADALQKLHPSLTPETLGTNTPEAQINLLLIDQFEELFIQSDTSQRAPFCDFLINLPNFVASRIHILITLRVDYLDELFAVQPLWAKFDQTKVELRTMSADDLRNAIQKPLQVHYPLNRFAPELLDRLVQDAGEDAALLPLLQVTLAELWKTGKLVLSNYHSLTNAIRQRAETVYAFSDYDKADPKISRSTDEQAELMAILLDLINVSVDGDDRRDVRQRRTRHELEQGSTQRPQFIEELVNARLLTAANEVRNGKDVEVIDIIHESLIDNWDRLRNAIENQRQQLQRRARFKLWLGEWVRNERQDGYLLLTDMQLAEARVLVEGRDIEVQAVEAREFYQRSLERQEVEHQKELQRAKELVEAQRRRAQTFRNAVVVASLLFLLTAGAAGVSFYLSGRLGKVNTQLTDKNKQLDQTNSTLANTVTQLNQTVDQLDTTNSQLQQTISETQRLANIAFSRQLAAQSASELSKGHYEPAILLAIESGQITDTLEAFSVIRSAIANPGHSRLVLYGHRGIVYQATWSADESRILTSSADGTARIWDAATGKELFKLEGHTGPAREAAWSADESRVLTTSDDGTARIWNAATGKGLVKLEGHTRSLYQAAWSADESRVLTTSDDNTARIWDAATGKQLVKLEGHTRLVFEATWSADESRILTSSFDNTARIWDAAAGKELVKLEGHTSFILQATWSANESRILTSSFDNTARIWDAATGKQLVKLEGHTGPVREATWSANESRILTRSDDNTARIWDTVTGKELVRLEGHTGPIWQATWSEDESRILTSSDDNTAYIWDAATGKQLIRLEGHANSVREATWSEDESRVLTGSDDGTARIWNAATGKQLVKLEGHTRSLSQVIWSADESRILTSSNDGTARIWDTATDDELVRLEGHTGPVREATWSADESRILTSSFDNTARIWDAATGKELVKLGGYIRSLSQANWNADESRILASSDDNTARIWDAATGEELVKLEGHTGPVREATWSANESRILTSSEDHTARIWDAATGKELVKLEGHTGPVREATWSANESRILTSSGDDDHTARVWDAATGKELTRLEGHTAFVYQAIWSEDESRILTRSDDNTVRVWDAATGKQLVKLEGHTSYASQTAWSADESRILTSSGESFSDDNTARIWDAATGKQLVRLEGHTSPILQATWSADENRILTSSFDYTARVWDAATGKQLVKLEGHTGPVREATWSANESRILTRSDDNTARVWDAVTGKELVRLEGHTRPVLQATWSADESRILTSSDDGTVRIWYMQMTDLLLAACQWTPRNFTESERNIYIQDVQGNYRPTCLNAPIPPDAIAGIQDEARQQILAGQVASGMQRLEELNGWLGVNGQFKNYGVDVPVFVAEISATATAEAKPAQ